ncbi:hypothetical protein Pan153_15700 [Gimesia panareensis]|uniref:Uncharacterized protein n=2 Tax=Gimesia panareensis TaxID=2527978 RepID=A0A518FKQ6_9PLAN|nr:hypothetical protein Pan153_15700 [Gimesia panareensis]
MFHRYDSPVFSKGRNYQFETAVPSPTEIRDEMEAITLLPVSILEKEFHGATSFSLAFVCLPQVRLGVEYHRSHSGNDEQSTLNQEYDWSQTISIEPCFVERSLCWSIELALRNLGGKVQCRSLHEELDEFARKDARLERQMYYYCHRLSEVDVRRRHRRTVLWKWCLLFCILLLGPVIYIWEKTRRFFSEAKSLWQNLEWDFKWDWK